MVMSKDFTYEVKKTFVSVESGSDGWLLELNLVSWNGRSPVYDLRKWNSDHSKMGKGVSMSEEEVVSFLSESENILREISGKSDCSNKEDVVNNEVVESSDNFDIPF